MFPSIIEVRGDVTQDLEHLATLNPDTPQYPLQPRSVSGDSLPLFSVIENVNGDIFKGQPILLKTESLHTYFSILFIQEMLLEGWLVVGVPWLYVKH